MHAEKIILLLVIALVVTNAVWWVRVRGLNGVVSDLKNIRSDVKNINTKVSGK